MKFPHLSKEQKLTTKVTDKDIAEIKSLFASGWNKAQLAEKFGISRAQIRYWLMTVEERKALNAKRKFRSKKPYSETKEQHAKYFQHKQEVQKEEHQAYKNEVNARYKKNHIEEIRAKDRAYSARKRAERREANATN